MTAIPAATTVMAADGDSACSRKPASSEPSGITPQPICRATLLVRPRRWLGVIRIRYVWTDTFHDGPTKPNTVTTGHSHSGTRITTISASSTVQIHMQPVMVMPTGTLCWNQGAANAPARPPAPMHATMTPTSAGAAPSCLASTMRPRVRTCNSTFTEAAKKALYLRNGCRQVQASPSPSSARSLPTLARNRREPARNPPEPACETRGPACIGALMKGSVTREAR